jgi:hypothetical protein
MLRRTANTLSFEEFKRELALLGPKSPSFSNLLDQHSLM